MSNQPEVSPVHIIAGAVVTALVLIIVVIVNIRADLKRSDRIQEVCIDNQMVLFGGNCVDQNGVVHDPYFLANEPQK